MCVTNFVKRNLKPQAVPASSAMISTKPSLISELLVANFMPLMMNAPRAEPSSALSSESQIPSVGPQCTLFTSSSAMVGPMEVKKSRPKRRRKPQKPGLTAKRNERHFVKHDYHDHAFDPDEHDEEEEEDIRVHRKGVVSQSFPMKLHSVLGQVEADGFADIVSWQTHGRCFIIHKTDEFVDHIMPNYFRQSKLTSFQRQLNLYGFARLTRGKDAGAYYHELFLRGKVCLAKRMKRTKIKGTKFKAASSPEMEPDFYTMPPIVVTPHGSDESSIDNDDRADRSNGMVGLAESIRLTTDIAPIDFQPSAGFDPTPFKYQSPLVIHGPVGSSPAIEPYQMAVAANHINTPQSWSMQGETMPNGMSRDILNWKFLAEPNAASVAAPRSARADHILDEAVDQIFSSGGLPEDVANMDDLWDNTPFCDETVQDDAQLGFLLDRFLEEDP